MSVMSRCFRRFAAGLVGAFLALALIAVPAWANGDTITAQATVPFSGAVDNPTSCSAPHGDATIDWGDGTATSAGTITHTGGSYIVSGTHTYAEAAIVSNPQDGTVTLSGGACDAAGSPTTDTFTATVTQAPPMFTQCPPVDESSGCQFLISVTNSGETVVPDPNQGPYEGIEDSLIGVVNNSSTPIYELPLSVPSSDLFGFDGDGICDPGGAPLLTGCVPTSQSPAGQVCDGGQDEGCAFPPPTSTNPAPAGYVPSGYEGPDQLVLEHLARLELPGVVNFSPTPAARPVDLLQSGGAADRKHHRRWRNCALLPGRPAADGDEQHRGQLLGHGLSKRIRDDGVLPVRNRAAAIGDRASRPRPTTRPLRCRP